MNEIIITVEEKTDDSPEFGGETHSFHMQQVEPITDLEKGLLVARLVLCLAFRTGGEQIELLNGIIKDLHGQAFDNCYMPPYDAVREFLEKEPMEEDVDRLTELIEKFNRRTHGNSSGCK
jgi:hypothetical protein